MKNLNLRIWSLFSGIGGLEKGLEDSGLGKVQLQCEIDPFAQSILNKHWPLVPVIRSVKEITSKNLEKMRSPELICGGFPCQPHSVAGKRKGTNDERHLWPEFARIIKEFKPRFVVAENVPGIRKNGALAEVLSDLADCGYDAEWIRLGAAAVGAPHLRERIFIVAYSGSERRRKIAGEARFNEASYGEWKEENYFSDSDAKGVGGSTPFIFTDAQRAKLPILPANTVWAYEPDLPRVANGIPNRVDRLRVLGNAVVPQVAQFVGECIYDAIA